MNSDIKLKNPTSVRILSYLLSEKGESVHDTLDKNEPLRVLKRIERKYNAEKVDESFLRTVRGKYECQINLYEGRDYCFYKINVTPQDDILSEDWRKDKNEEEKLTEEIVDELPDKPTFDASIFLCNGFGNLDKGSEFLREYSSSKNRILNAGIVYDTHVVGRLEGNLDSSRRKFLLVPAGSFGEDRLNVIIDDLAFLSAHLGKTHRLFHYYSQAGHSEIEKLRKKSVRECDRTIDHISESIQLRSESGTELSGKELNELDNHINSLNKILEKADSYVHSINFDLQTYEKSLSFAEEIFSSWDESKLEGYSRISPSETQNLRDGAKLIESELKELEGIQNRIRDLLEMIETKMDMGIRQISKSHNKLIGLLALIFAIVGSAELFVTFAFSYASDLISRILITTTPIALIITLLLLYFKKKDILLW